MKMYNLTPEEYDAYIRAKLIENAEEIALSEIFEKGRASEKIEMAKEMLIDNEPIEKIVKYTKLLKAEIKK